MAAIASGACTKNSLSSHDTKIMSAAHQIFHALFWYSRFSVARALAQAAGIIKFYVRVQAD
jgi:hypothetical protein